MEDAVQAINAHIWQLEGVAAHEVSNDPALLSNTLICSAC